MQKEGVLGNLTDGPGEWDSVGFFVYPLMRRGSSNTKGGERFNEVVPEGGVSSNSWLEEMEPKFRRRLIWGMGVMLSAGILFALGETPRLIEQLINYPNPFDSRKEETFISYRLPQDLPVRVRIYDLFGYRVKEFNFSAGELGARRGENIVRWDGTDGSGQKVSMGGYLCQVTVEGEQSARGIRKIGVIH